MIDKIEYRYFRFPGHGGEKDFSLSKRVANTRSGEDRRKIPCFIADDRRNGKDRRSHR